MTEATQTSSGTVIVVNGEHMGSGDELVDKIAVGRVSNMREIAQRLMNAQKVVTI